MHKNQTLCKHKDLAMFWFKSISAGKMKDETDGLSFKDFFVIKPKTYWFLVDDFSQ